MLYIIKNVTSLTRMNFILLYQLPNQSTDTFEKFTDSIKFMKRQNKNLFQIGVLRDLNKQNFT